MYIYISSVEWWLDDCVKINRDGGLYLLGSPLCKMYRVQKKKGVKCIRFKISVSSLSYLFFATQPKEVMTILVK
jgi:hypothetical protein